MTQATNIVELHLYILEKMSSIFEKIKVGIYVQLNYQKQAETLGFARPSFGAPTCKQLVPNLQKKTLTL